LNIDIAYLTVHQLFFFTDVSNVCYLMKINVLTEITNFVALLC